MSRLRCTGTSRPATLSIFDLSQSRFISIISRGSPLHPLIIHFNTTISKTSEAETKCQQCTWLLSTQKDKLFALSTQVRLSLILWKDSLVTALASRANLLTSSHYVPSKCGIKDPTNSRMSHSWVSQGGTTFSLSGPLRSWIPPNQMSRKL